MNKVHIRIKEVNEFTRLVIERKRIEQQLTIEKDLAEQKSRIKSDFLSSISHELRTPLNHIIGFTELLLDKSSGDLNDTQEDYLNDVLNSSHHLLALINDLLDLSKVEANKMELSLSDICFPDFIESCTRIIQDQACKHHIHVSIDKTHMPPIIQADELKLKQIIYNLLSNAVKFTPDHGKITIHACQSENPAVVFNRQKRIKKGSYIKISVKDTGIGLEPKDMTLIFNPFDQVKNPLSQRKRGTGLGLSLTRKLVELHGGDIWVESRGKNQGSCFHFILPLRRSTPPASS